MNAALTVCFCVINYSIKDYIGSLADGNLHYLSVRYQESADGTQQKGLVYLDGVLAYEGVWTGKIAYPAAAVNLNGIESNLADTTPFADQFYRARIDAFTLVSKTALQVIAEEMAAVAGKFS
ncbi:hypothetical protein KPC142_06703 [Klebsiella quasipneumoniae]|nr:hypothetical protein KPC142_06703 [Klebsiella quasipneumoniae]